jgi:hypothetical protein
MPRIIEVIVSPQGAVSAQTKGDGDEVSGRGPRNCHHRAQNG